MAPNKNFDAYYERLRVGREFYFVEGESIIGQGDLTVKKATLVTMTDESSELLERPEILIWDDVKKNPGDHGGYSATKSPKDLFTLSEVAHSIARAQSHLMSYHYDIDGLLEADEHIDDLVEILAEAALKRHLADGLPDFMQSEA